MVPWRALEVRVYMHVQDMQQPADVLGQGQVGILNKQMTADFKCAGRPCKSPQCCMTLVLLHGTTSQSRWAQTIDRPGKMAPRKQSNIDELEAPQGTAFTHPTGFAVEDEMLATPGSCALS